MALHLALGHALPSASHSPSYSTNLGREPSAGTGLGQMRPVNPASTEGKDVWGEHASNLESLPITLKPENMTQGCSGGLGRTHSRALQRSVLRNSYHLHQWDGELLEGRNAVFLKQPWIQAVCQSANRTDQARFPLYWWWAVGLWASYLNALCFSFVIL